MTDFQISPELLNIYLEDARAHLEALDHALLALEREGLDAQVVSGILGPLHTLKGNSGMMGFAGIKDYVHRLEDVFVRIGQGTVALSRPLFDRLFAGASALRDAVEQACRQRAEVRHLESDKRILEGILKEAPPGPPITPAPSAPPADEPPAASVVPAGPSALSPPPASRSSALSAPSA